MECLQEASSTDVKESHGRVGEVHTWFDNADDKKEEDDQDPDDDQDEGDDQDKGNDQDKGHDQDEGDDNDPGDDPMVAMVKGKNRVLERTRTTKEMKKGNVRRI
eukprot:6233429-Karenia_brevis.AAC.1